MANFLDESEPVWDPIQQIYLGGRLPGSSDAEVKAMIEQSGLRVFGYGSLTWKPSGWLQNGIAGRIYGYRRVWAQKSTDHRGTPKFPGLVCTLLKNSEFRSASTMKTRNDGDNAFVDGLVYHVPDSHVADCLKDLDFREKGGYAREIVNVTIDTTGESLPCLVYRGTPDNPAFWPRALNDLQFAASVVAVAVGPSGPNTEYLKPLADFLRAKNSIGDETLKLWEYVQKVKPEEMNFLAGCGSNQHGQLISDPQVNDEIHLLTEFSYRSESPLVKVIAGGGHTAFLDEVGNLDFFGWNDFGQAPLQRCSNVQMASLGFSHTVIIDKVTNRLKAFGDDRHQQVSSITNSSYYKTTNFVSVSAGLFHTAAITDDGTVIIFRKDGICEFTPFGSTAVKVVCGKHITIVLDAAGRLWSSGTSNKYQELGRSGDCTVFGLVEIAPGDIVDVDCGWSHALASTKDGYIFGWGRNDKGQIGKSCFPSVTRAIACGSESSYIVDCDEDVWSTGWNEHGNLADGSTKDRADWHKVEGPSFEMLNKKIAAGGAHMIVYSGTPKCN